MRTLAVWLVLAAPVPLGATHQPHLVHPRAKPGAPPAATCTLGCHAHRERVAVRRTRRLARTPLARRIPRWREWHCIARYESRSDWRMSPTSTPRSGGSYWGGLQMDVPFMRTYGADMIRRHHGGLADTWTAAEQIVVANRAWQARGYAPWPSTSHECGLA